MSKEDYSESAHQHMKRATNKMGKKYVNNVMSPKDYAKMKVNKKMNLKSKRKRKGKLSGKRIEELSK